MSIKQRPKTTTSHDVKSFAIGSFLEQFVVKNSKWLSLLKKTLNTLVKSVQNHSISSKICLENSHKIIGFLPIVFAVKLSPKLVDFSVNLSLNIPQNLTFFHDLSEALILGLTVLHLTSSLCALLHI